ncbi:hypothetical protein BDW22DRAFT_1419479 [Trametopsis cervina]|nr:hypothetical protein BDW22DRAFT_1419479 [Trametopsis cervina]
MIIRPHYPKLLHTCYPTMAAQVLARFTLSLGQLSREEFEELKAAFEERTTPRAIEDIDDISSLLHRWWWLMNDPAMRVRRSLRNEESPIVKECTEVRRKVLLQTPLPADFLDKMPVLIPNLGTRKAPMMHFGWLVPYQVLSALVIKECGPDWDKRNTLWEPDSDDDDEIEPQPQRQQHPIDEADTMLSIVYKSLGFDKTLSGDFFQLTQVCVEREIGYYNNEFIAIYSNHHLMPRAKWPLPTAEHINRFQERLGLRGPPGWWFDHMYYRWEDWSTFTREVCPVTDFLK